MINAETDVLPRLSSIFNTLATAIYETRNG